MHMYTPLGTQVNVFQSAPDREVGRCSTCGKRMCGRNCFNPRPTVRSGDADLIPTQRWDDVWFQSAPDREVGRCPSPTVAEMPLDRFNPRPTVRSGDAFAGLIVLVLVLSFNPRPTVRSGDAAWPESSRTATSGFNPRPTVRSGDAPDDSPQRAAERVSIRARP